MSIRVRAGTLRSSVLRAHPPQEENHMSDEETGQAEEDALKDADITSGGEAESRPPEGLEGDEGEGTGEGDAGPASGSSGPGSGG
jgi:hypothetical protein